MSQTLNHIFSMELPLSKLGRKTNLYSVLVFCPLGILSAMTWYPNNMVLALIIQITAWSDNNIQAGGHWSKGGKNKKALKKVSTLMSIFV